MAVQSYTVRRTGDEDTDRNLDEIARAISSIVAAVKDGDKGDVVVSGSGTIWTVRVEDAKAIASFHP